MINAIIEHQLSMIELIFTVILIKYMLPTYCIYIIYRQHVFDQNYSKN